MFLTRMANTAWLRDYGEPDGGYGHPEHDVYDEVGGGNPLAMVRMAMRSGRSGLVTSSLPSFLAQGEGFCVVRGVGWAGRTAGRDRCAGPAPLRVGVATG